MNRNLHFVAAGAAFLGLGLSMPSCPGQQAMQQQIDALQAKNQELSTKVQMHDNQIKAMAKDLNETVKPLVDNVGKTVLAQQDTLKQIEEKLAASSSKGKPAAKGAAPARKKK